MASILEDHQNRILVGIVTQCDPRDLGGNDDLSPKGTSQSEMFTSDNGIEVGASIVTKRLLCRDLDCVDNIAGFVSQSKSIRVQIFRGPRPWTREVEFSLDVERVDSSPAQ